MRKLILAVMILGTLTTSSHLYGQEKSKREIRKEARELAYNQNKTQMAIQLESQNFQYQATELVSSGHAAISNIRLNSHYYVRVTPTRFNCYLPIYGMSSPVGRATLLRRLDISSNDYEMKIKDTGKQGFNVQITTRDNVGNSKYTFNFNIPADGKMSRLSVATDFQGPVSYSGSVTI